MFTGFREWVRAHVPAGPRLAIARARRGLRDRLTGDAGRIARPSAGLNDAPCRIVAIVQPIRNSGMIEGKLANIRLGAARLDGLAIGPGALFSFWATIGRPSDKAGFRLGRSIRGGAVTGEVGGGLCQVSGIMYELLLRGGLTPVERHPHSRDLYSEEERFTPLGLDATVVWPYRDLRMLNTLELPVVIRLSVDGMTLRAELHAPRPIEPASITITRTDHAGDRDVRVERDGRLVSADVYRLI